MEILYGGKTTFYQTDNKEAELRSRKIHEGLNVIENWNGANCKS